MIGRNHIIAGTASVALVDGLLHGASALPVVNRIPSVASLVNQYHGMFLQGEGFAKVLWVIEAIALFYVGVLLPDIDTGQSLIRKATHSQSSKVKEDGHRTWTHSIWAILLLCLLAWKVPVCFWLVFGYSTHLFWDMWSAMGICLLYPLQKYKKFESGAKVANGHRLKLYHTGQVSEYVFVFVICGIALVAWFFCHVRYWVAAISLIA